MRQLWITAYHKSTFLFPSSQFVQFRRSELQDTEQAYCKDPDAYCCEVLVYKTLCTILAVLGGVCSTHCVALDTLTSWLLSSGNTNYPIRFQGEPLKLSKLTFIRGCSAQHKLDHDFKEPLYEGRKPCLTPRPGSHGRLQSGG